jgi:glycosyltransferase involved in cell wall biosynthesis
VKHLIICREYPPAPSGGIGTYVQNISQLLAESGETVHVIGQLWEGAEQAIEERCDGNLIIHRVPVQDWSALLDPKPSPRIRSKKVRALFRSDFYPQCFSWQAGRLAERLIQDEGIDVVEAQEYEAPLYYFQLRRALGLGPKKRPPCIVHLHSPTQFIARYNEWDIGSPAVLTAKRLEDYTIAAADALLCPSRYLAGQIEAHYGMPRGTIRVLPLPSAGFPMLLRDEETWKRGPICYVGRLERRKGVIEWVDAAVSVASEYPEASFEFIGLDMLDNNRMSMQEFLAQRIPRRLKKRFHFRGQQERSQLPRFLAKARMAVIPSRWENFPFTCVEAMSSGLPVIASRDGGMAEMIEDGRTGWLANKTGSEGLAEALRRALRTEPVRIAEMGRSASGDIRQLCNGKKILETQLDFRSQLVSQGPKYSLRLPRNLPWVNRPLFCHPIPRSLHLSSHEGIAVVITGVHKGSTLDSCLRSLQRQTRQPVMTVVVGGASPQSTKLETISRNWQDNVRLIYHENGESGSAKNAGVEAVFRSGLNPLAFCFLNPEDRLHPRLVAECESILRSCPKVGVVSCWVGDLQDSDNLWIKPCPSLPYQYLANDTASFSVVRAEALREERNLRSLPGEREDQWELFNSVIASGWIAVTIPDVLGYQSLKDGVLAHMKGDFACTKRQELIGMLPDLGPRDAQELHLLSESQAAQQLRKSSFNYQRQLAIMRMALYHPQWAALHIVGKIKGKILRYTLAKIKPSIATESILQEDE